MPHKKALLIDYLPELAEGLLELSWVKLTVAVDIHPLEDLAESANAHSASSGLESELELEIELSDFDFDSHAVECHIFIIIIF